MIKLIWKYINCPTISVTLVTIRFRTRIQSHDQMKNSFSQLPSALFQAANSASFQLCTVLWNMKGQRKSLGTPVWFSSRCWHTAFTESQQHWGLITAVWTPNEQLPLIRSITNLQEVVSVHLVAGRVHDARGQPDALGGTGQALPTQGWQQTQPEKGLGLGTALHLSLCSQTPRVWFLWSMLMLNCHHHHHRHCTVKQCQPR